MTTTIPTIPSRYADEAGFYKSEAILRIAGSSRSGGPGGWSLGGWTAEAEARTYQGGPKVRGPHAYIYGLAGCIAANPRASTRGEHDAAAAEGRLFDLADGDLLEVEGTVYRLTVDGRGYPHLEATS